MMQTALKTDFGVLDGTPESWTAQLTESGSTAIQEISYDNNLVTVVFRNQAGTGRSYEYTTDEDTARSFYEELTHVIDGEGSIGRLVQQSLHNNKLQLV